MICGNIKFLFHRVCVPWSRGFGNTAWCGWTLSPEGARLDRYVEEQLCFGLFGLELILAISAQRDAMKQGGVRAQVWLGPLTPHPSFVYNLALELGSPVAISDVI